MDYVCVCVYILSEARKFWAMQKSWISHAVPDTYAW